MDSFYPFKIRRTFAASNNDNAIFETAPPKSAAPRQSQKASFRFATRLARSLTCWNNREPLNGGGEIKVYSFINYLKVV